MVGNISNTKEKRISPDEYSLKASSFSDLKISLETHFIKMGSSSTSAFKENETEVVTYTVMKMKGKAGVGLYIVEAKSEDFSVYEIKRTVKEIRNTGRGEWQAILFCFNEIPQEVQDFMLEKWEFSKVNYISRTPVIEIPIFVDMKQKRAYIPNMKKRKYIVSYKPYLKRTLELLSPFLQSTADT